MQIQTLCQSSLLSSFVILLGNHDHDDDDDDDDDDDIMIYTYLCHENAEFNSAEVIRRRKHLRGQPYFRPFF